MKITLTIPDGHANRVIEAVAKSCNYNDMVPDLSKRPPPQMPNPESKTDFMRRQIVEWLMSHVERVEAERDAEAARKAAKDKIKSEVVITA